MRKGGDFAEPLEKVVRESAALNRQGRFQASAALCCRALRHKPDSAQILNNQGVALAGMGRLAEAEAASLRALRSSPNFAPEAGKLARCLSSRTGSRRPCPSAKARCV